MIVITAATMENGIVSIYYVPVFSDQFSVLFSTILKQKHFYWKKCGGRVKNRNRAESDFLGSHPGSATG